MTEDLKQQFSKNGFVHIRSLLTAEEVTKLRAQYFSMFDGMKQKTGVARVTTLPPSYCFKQQEIFKLTLKKRVVQVLGEILQPDYELVPDLEVHKNSFGLKKPRLFGLMPSGWHIDSGGEGRQPHFKDPNYRFVKCGIYLQDNTQKFGGGIQVTPGVYDFPFKTGLDSIDYPLRKASHALAALVKPHTVDIKAGDFVAFHSFLPHRGTLPQNAVAMASENDKNMDCLDLPEENSKIVVYFCASRKGYAKHYMKYAVKRGAGEVRGSSNTTSKKAAFFVDFAAMKYPDDYANDFVKKVESTEISIPSNEGKALQHAIEVRNQAIKSKTFGNLTD